MMGHRFDVDPTQFEYIVGLLIDEGLVADQDWMPAGGATVIVTEAGWATLDHEVQQEIGRHIRGPQVESVDTGQQVESTSTGEQPDEDPSAAATPPADDDGKDREQPATRAPRASRSTKASTSEGAH